ncbi:antibiotic biosynthesis monooxygenase [bacterium]|nr:antibiotic biosynthesis monooxygenase [bacterium]
MIKKTIFTFAVLSLMILFTKATGQSQEKKFPDPATKYPGNYKVLLENDRVRVLDFVLRKGDTEDFHMHPAHVAYILQGFKIRFTFPDGKTAIREAKAGEVLFSEAVVHSPLNIGDTDAHGILIEMKNSSVSTKSMNDEQDLIAATFIHGLPGKEEDLKSHLLSLTVPTRAEAGCLKYDLYQSTDKKNEFMRFEIWKDLASLETHKKSPHLRSSFEKRQKEGWKTEITLWKEVGTEN